VNVLHRFSPARGTTDALQNHRKRPRDQRRYGKPKSKTRRSKTKGEHMKLMTLIRDERGSATAEYAVATMAAVGFAGLLVVLLRGDEVRSILTDLVKRALSTAG
jgi:Flp pilus assembly pilin Flp